MLQVRVDTIISFAGKANYPDELKALKYFIIIKNNDMGKESW